jgi:hypothetical protein
VTENLADDPVAQIIADQTRTPLLYGQRALAALQAAGYTVVAGPVVAWLLVCDDGKRYVSCGEPFRSTPTATAYPLYAGAALQSGSTP